MTTYRLVPRALQDLDLIADYSLERWGADQTQVYIEALFKRFQWLAEHPRLGQDRSEIRPELRSFPEGRHFVVYKIADEGIDILAVPHRSMDLENYLD